MAQDGAYPVRLDAGEAPLPPLGLWAAALFHVCLAILPLAAAYAAYLVSHERLYTYHPSPAAARAARAGLERLAAGFIEPGEDRRLAWDNLIVGELMSNDIHAARGFLLSARTMLRGADAGQLTRALGGDRRDADLEAAALALLTPSTRARYLATVPLLSRSEGLTKRRPLSPPLVGDATDLAADAEADLTSPDFAHLRFVLTGTGVILGSQLSPRALAGISLLRGGLAMRRLPDALTAALSAHAEAAAPRARFRAEMTRRAGAERSAMVDGAFRASLDAPALARFEQDLAGVGALADTLGDDGALALLGHARGLEDLQRLQLLAETSPDRAVAVAKHAPADGAVALAARGWLRFTPELIVALAAAACAGLGVALTALATAVEAMARALERLHVIQRERPGKRPGRTPALVRDLGGARKFSRSD